MVLLQAAEPLLTWQDVVREYAGFLGAFLPVGAVGFRYFVLGPLLRNPPAARLSAALPTAATIGTTGSVLRLIVIGLAIVLTASARHLTVVQTLARQRWALGIALALGVVMLASFAIAVRDARAWPMAAVATIALALSSAIAGKWQAMINPLHVLAGGLWIGTLFVMLIAGLSLILRGQIAVGQRGLVTAAMVNRFSTLALWSAGLLVLTGLTTAWRHLHVLSSLWTTPYGLTLIVKLCFVATVFALGAFNWRRVRPTLASEGTAIRLRRSATAELTVAGIVLAITAILVSLPAPRPPRPPGGAPTTSLRP